MEVAGGGTFRLEGRENKPKISTMVWGTIERQLVMSVCIVLPAELDASLLYFYVILFNVFF